MRSVLIWLVAALVLSACARTTLLNNLTPERGYDVATNLIYEKTNNLRLDIYTPRNVQGASVVIFFHGGRWESGSKDEYKFVGEALASRGFVAVIPEVRQYPKVRFPAFIYDAAAAVAWTRENIGRYGGASDKLFVMGHSSGAHIAAFLALKDDFLEKVGGSRQWLRGMIGLAGPYNFLPLKDPTLRDIFAPPENFHLSQPILFVTGDNPPMLLMHGENDETVLVQNTRSLAEAVAKAGGPVETVIYPDMSHGLILGSISSVLRGRTDVLSHITDFVTRWSDNKYVERVTPPPGGIETTPFPQP